MIGKITAKEIEKIKKEHILKNLMYTPVEAAELLSISVKTLFRLEEEGLIKSEPLRPGQTVQSFKRFNAYEIEQYRLLRNGNMSY